MSKLSEKVTLQKLGSEELSLLTNMGQMVAEFFSMFNGPLLISLQYHRENENKTIFLWKEKIISAGPVGGSETQSVGVLREMNVYSSPLVLKVECVSSGMG